MMTRFAYFAITRAVSNPIPFIDVPVIRTAMKVSKSRRDSACIRGLLAIFPSDFFRECGGDLFGSGIEGEGWVGGHDAR
jgi:hypothetical protein